MPTVWPPEKRKGTVSVLPSFNNVFLAFCWTPRQAIYDKSAEPGCHSKEGNPFGPYWDQIDVSFVGDEYFGDIPGGFDLNQMGSRKKWLEKFPSEEYPVLAFSSAPAPFPSKGKVWSIQKYLRWSSRITEQAKKFISANLAKPFVAVHLRNDADWVRFCDVHLICSHLHLGTSLWAHWYNYESAIVCLGTVSWRGASSGHTYQRNMLTEQTTNFRAGLLIQNM